MIFNDERGRPLPTIAVGSGPTTENGVCRAYSIQRKLVKRFQSEPRIIDEVDALHNTELVKYEDQLMNILSYSELVQFMKRVRHRRLKTTEV